MQQEPDSDLIDQLIAGSPFIRFMGLELVSLDAGIGEVAMKMPIRPEFERGGPMTGQFHGPYLVARARVRRSGRTVAVVDVDILDDHDRLTAVGRACYSAQTG